MPFFLIGKTPEGSLYLVSERLSETRSDALAELGRVTGASDFTGWDDQVMVFDLDAGVPVLLVRPSMAAEQRAPVAPEPIGLPSADVMNADVESGHGDALLRSAAPMETISDESDVDAPLAVQTHDESPEPQPATWPWDVKDSPRPFSLDALEEPGDDEGSLIRAAGDDETMAAARPVVLDAYESAPQAEEPEGSFKAPSDYGPVPASEAAVEVSIPVEPEPELRGSVLVEESASAVEPLQPHEESDSRVREVLDFLAGVDAEPSGEASELENALSEADRAEPDKSLPVESPGPSVTLPASDFIDLGPTPGSESGHTALDTMTCDDCVYVETCPNKDQRNPASCGSFQWK